MNTTKLMEMIKSNGGITYNVKNGKAVEGGYVCAVKGYELVIKDMTKKKLKRYIINNKTVLKSPLMMLGVWYNSENGLYYLDVSKVYDNKAEALDYANKMHELAIFDLNTMTEIKTN